jgi:hypothetical protein
MESVKTYCLRCDSEKKLKNVRKKDGDCGCVVAKGNCVDCNLELITSLKWCGKKV